MLELLGLDFGPPTTWLGVVAIGTAIGLVIAYFASREYIRRTIQVLKDTIASQAEQIKAEKELAITLAETHAALIMAVEKKLEVMTGERDVYRKDLHDLREVHTPLLLEVQEMKLRPDLNAVLQKEEAWHARREEFYTNMAGNQRGIIETQRDCLKIIGEIKTAVDEELKQSNEVCAAVGKALQDIVMKMDEREEASASRDQGMVELLTEIRDRLPSKA